MTTLAPVPAGSQSRKGIPGAPYSIPFFSRLFFPPPELQIFLKFLQKHLKNFSISPSCRDHLSITVNERFPPLLNPLPPRGDGIRTFTSLPRPFVGEGRYEFRGHHT